MMSLYPLEIGKLSHRDMMGLLRACQAEEIDVKVLGSPTYKTKVLNKMHAKDRSASEASVTCGYLPAQHLFLFFQ